MPETSPGELRVRLGEIRGAARSLERNATLFGALFDGVQSVESTEPIDVRPTYMSLVAGATTEVDRIGLCLEHAEANHWLAALAKSLVYLSSMPPTEFLELLLGPHAPGPSEPLPAGADAWCASRVCRIGGDEVEPGTGFLVGPDLVLTCHHVVARALTPGGRLRMGAEVVCRFGRTGREPGTLPASGAELAARVVAVESCSPAATIEFGSGARTRLVDLAGFDDFALLRLASSPGDVRGWFPLAGPPPVSGSVHVWHRTGGAPVAYACAQVTQHRSPKTLRRLYMDLTIGQTGKGASGSPYANAHGEAVALHQAGGAARAGRRNRAIPASSAAAAVAGTPTTVTPLWWVEADVALPEATLGTSGSTAPYYYPLVGRFALQAAVRLARDPGAAVRLIRVDGPPGSGRTRTRFIIRTLCHEQQHLVTTFDLSALSRDARPLMEAVYNSVLKGARVVAASPLAIDPGALTDYETAKRFTAAWIAQVNVVRGGRLVWVCIDGFGQHPLPTEGDRLCLEALVALLSERPWLRLCLMGSSPSFEGQPQFTEIITPPDEAEIAHYLRRRIVAAGFEPPAPALIPSFIAAMRAAASDSAVTPEHVVVAVDGILQTKSPDRQSVRLIDPWGAQ